MHPLFQMENKKLLLEVLPVGNLQMNCSLIMNTETKETIVIDSGNDYKRLSFYLEKKGCKILELLHTHAHFDHIGQSSDLQHQTGALMALHADDHSLYATLNEQLTYFREPISEKLSPITHLLQDGETIRYENFISFKVLHTPGHTQGGVCFYTEDFGTPIAFTGDTLFHGAIGRTDLSGGNYEQLLRSIKTKLLVLPEETIVIPGHEEGSTIGEEKRENPYLKSLR